MERQEPHIQKRWTYVYYLARHNQGLVHSEAFASINQALAWLDANLNEADQEGVYILDAPWAPLEYRPVEG